MPDLQAVGVTSTNCKLCGMKKLAFLRLLDDMTRPVLKPNGDETIIPLDLSAPVYVPVEEHGALIGCRRLKHGYVSHFATCPNLDESSRAKRPTAT